MGFQPDLKSSEPIDIPYGVASALGRLQWLWAELTGHPPQLTHGEVGVFREEWACDSARAARRSNTPF